MQLMDSSPMLGAAAVQDTFKLIRTALHNYLRSKEGQLAGRTISHHRSVLRAALNQAVEWELLYRNPATHVRLPKIEAKPSRFLTPGEAAAVLAAFAGDRLEALYSVALALGLRQGEALGLQMGRR